MVCFIRYLGNHGKLAGTFTVGHPKNIYGSDRLIAEFLKLSIKEYQAYLIENFNARKIVQTKSKEDVYFVNHNDLVKAIEWIESVSIINKLRD